MIKIKYFYLFFKLIFFKLIFCSRIKLNSYRIGFERNVKIIVKGKKSQISFGRNTYLMRNGNLEVYDGGLLEIGNNVSINKNASIVSRNKIRIGNNVSIGPNCCIYDHDHDFSNKDQLVQQQGYISTEIFIGDDVWIASNVFIGKGVKISNGAIIASGSVVVNDVEENTVVGGVPAKFIKNRF